MTGRNGSGRGRPRSLRPSTTDRESYADILEDAYAEERLDAAELETRSTTLWAATTIGELDDLVADVRPPTTPLPEPRTPDSRPPEAEPRALVETSTRPGRDWSPPSERRSRGPLLVGLVVLTICVVVVTMIVRSFGDEPAADGLVGPAANDMYSAAGLQEVVDDLAEAAGTNEFAEIDFYGEYAIASTLGAPGGDRMARLDWRDGEVSIEPAEEAPDEIDDLLYDVTTDVDWEALAVLARGAAERTGIADVESLYMWVERVSHTGDHEIQAHVNLSNDYQSASVTADHAGTVITAEGPGLEPDPDRFHVEPGVSDAIEAMKTRLGDSGVIEILFYGEYVLAQAPPEPGASVVASFSYRGGTTAILDSTAPSQPEDLDSLLFSLDDVDPGVIATLSAEAPELVGITGDATTYVFVERSTWKKSAPVQISVHVSGTYDSGVVVADLSGKVLEVS